MSIAKDPVLQVGFSIAGVALVGLIYTVYTFSAFLSLFTICPKMGRTHYVSALFFNIPVWTCLYNKDILRISFVWRDLCQKWEGKQDAWADRTVLIKHQGSSGKGVVIQNWVRRSGKRIDTGETKAKFINQHGKENIRGKTETNRAIHVMSIINNKDWQKEHKRQTNASQLDCRKLRQYKVFVCVLMSCTCTYS